MITYGALVLTIVLWGASWPASKLLLQQTEFGQTTLTPVMAATVRMTIASIFFLIPLVRARLARRDVIRMTILGQLSVSTYFWLQYVGIQKTNASIGALVVVGLIPSMTALTSAMLRDEKLTIGKMIALLLGFAGVAFIALRHDGAFQAGPDFIFGVVALLLNAFQFGLYSSLSNRWMREVSPLVMTSGTIVSGAIGLWLILLLGNPQWNTVEALSPAQWGALLFLAIGCSIIGLLGYNYTLTRLGATRTSAFNYFNPLVAILISSIFLAEPITLGVIIGGILIAASVVSVNALSRT